MCLLKNTIIASAATTAAAEWAPVCLPSLADGGFSIQFNIIWLFSPLKGSVNWAIKRKKKRPQFFFFPQFSPDWKEMNLFTVLCWDLFGLTKCWCNVFIYIFYIFFPF